MLTVGPVVCVCESPADSTASPSVSEPRLVFSASEIAQESPFLMAARNRNTAISNSSARIASRSARKRGDSAMRFNNPSGTHPSLRAARTG